MPRKVMLPTRLDQSVVARLNTLSTVNNLPVNDLINAALDALEREQNVVATVTERLEFMDKNLASLVELMMAFNEKMDRRFGEAGVNEKERLKGLYRLIEAKISEHDEAENARFGTLTPRR